MNPVVKFRKLHEFAIIPEYQTPGASGMDLYWDGTLKHSGFSMIIKHPFSMAPDSGPYLFGTGLCVEIPDGFEGQIRPRSSTGNSGTHCYLGTIDADYRGELLVRLQPLWRPSEVRQGDRIAQLVIAPVARATVVEVEELSETARGAGGFGSTGR